MQGSSGGRGGGVQVSRVKQDEASAVHVRLVIRFEWIDSAWTESCWY